MTVFDVSVKLEGFFRQRRDLVSNPPAVPLRLFQHHCSAGFKLLSLSPFCILMASPNEDYGGDSVTPPQPRRPPTSILTLSINPRRAGPSWKEGQSLTMQKYL